MLKNFIAIIFVLLVSLNANAAVEIGAIAPDFTAQTAESKQVSLSDYKDKIVVLEWSNYECPFVEKHYGSSNMQNLQKKYTDQGIIWLVVMSSAPGKQGYYDTKELLQQSKLNNSMATHILRDPSGQIGVAYAARTTPNMYIIDKGKLVYKGAIDSINSADPKDIANATNYVSDALDSLLKNEPIRRSFTQPYGCSIKY